MTGVAACLVGMGTPLVGVGVETAGVQSLGIPIAGVHMQGAMSPLNVVVVRLGSARTGCRGVTGQKLLTLGMGPIDSLISIAVRNIHKYPLFILGIYTNYSFLFLLSSYLRLLFLVNSVLCLEWYS